MTAGNASGICDGAAANIVASESALKQHNLKPLARIVSYAYSACEPSIMGIGPVESIKKALERAGSGYSLQDMDLIEVNEAFAAQTLAVQKELEIPNEKFNVHGGSIALGHPLGASGARITANVVHNLIRLDKKKAVVSACIVSSQAEEREERRLSLDSIINIVCNHFHFYREEDKESLSSSSESERDVAFPYIDATSCLQLNAVELRNFVELCYSAA